MGKTTFEYSADGSTLYALVQTPIIKGSEFYYSELQGAYVSNSGSFTGPWNKIADSNKLANSGLGAQGPGAARGPVLHAVPAGRAGLVQPVPRRRPDEPQARVPRARGGLRVVQRRCYLADTGPYWNFLFPCWTPGNTDPQNGCPTTTHSDQHDIAFGKVGGEPTAFVSNDGGVYSWPMTTGKVNKDGHGLELEVPVRGRDAADPAVLRGRRRPAERRQDRLRAEAGPGPWRADRLGWAAGQRRLDPVRGRADDGVQLRR